jgi:peptidoglycan/LPS O-acetylase OafA/YrhL
LAVRPHFAILDGLRGIAAVVVVAHHAFDPFDLSPVIPHSGLAVDLLFCLSGFVLAYAYEARLLKSMQLRDFVIIRFIRLYPLIVLGTFLGFLVFAVKCFSAHQSPFQPHYLFILVTELFLIPTPAIIGLDGWNGSTPFDTPAWSLFFQLIANIVYAALIHRMTNMRLRLALIVGAAIVLLQSYMLGGVQGGGSWGDLYGGFTRVCFPFFCGVFMFRVWNEGLRIPQGNYAFHIVALLLIVFFTPVPASVNWLFEALAVLLVFPLLIILGAHDTANPRLTSLYLFVGRLAYPLYILHYPVLRLFIKYEHANSLQGVQLWAVLTIEILTAIVFSLVVMIYFDEPVRAWLTRKWKQSLILFYPSAAKTYKGFRPMVMVRNAKGQSTVSSERVFADKETARNFARQAAHRVAQRLDYTRVA